MRVCHLITEPGSATRGVPRKVDRTLETWRRLGTEAGTIDLADGGSVPSRRWKWILEMERRGRRLLETLDRERPDIVYTRELLWTPAIESVFRRHRVVLELNADSGAELQRRSRAAAAWWRSTSGRLRRRAAGVTAVTGELGARLVPAGVPSLVVPNAADVPDAPPDRGEARGRPLVLMLVGEARPWHGIDRLECLAEAFPEFEVQVCGEAGEWRPRAGSPLRFIPPRRGEALERLLSEAAVCVGSLALSRAGLSEACTLKSRTALAAGVPLVYVGDDPSLQGDEDFGLRLPDRSAWATVDLDRFGAFVRRSASDREIGLSAWRFARTHLDRPVIERRRLEFMRSLLDLGR